MRIGTPLSPSATRVMMLGSGELGKEVVIELQRFGVEVIAVRSEEHTSELQSRSDLVCRLLLEKKNMTQSRDAERVREVGR